MKLKEITSYLENTAPLSLQESYDNSGLLTGNPGQQIDSILLTLDVTEKVIEEAIEKKANLIIAHHPILFTGLKKLTGSNYVERTIILAIKNDIAIYAAHTNIDNLKYGVSMKICEKLDLNNLKVLSSIPDQLCKLVTFIPKDHLQRVRNVIFDAGAGHIGNYDQCSFNLEGQGSFRASDEATPFVGNKNKIHFEKEIRLETVFPRILQKNIIKALLETHPYEKVAYDIYKLENKYEKAGMGLIGDLKNETDEVSFLKIIKNKFNVSVVRHTALLGKPLKKVAVCGGSGSFLLKKAISESADIFISSDFKYHQFFDADNKILIADIGHYESEQYTKEYFYELLIKKFSNFAIHLSEVNTNPITYF